MSLFCRRGSLRQPSLRLGACQRWQQLPDSCITGPRALVFASQPWLGAAAAAPLETKPDLDSRRGSANRSLDSPME